MSEAEQALLTLMAWVKLPTPEREYVFLDDRKFRFDFAWPWIHLAVEVEGGSWSGGRHTRGLGFERDCEKYNEATIAGWQVFRVTPAMIEDGRALALLERVFRKPIPPLPPPNPSLMREIR